MYHIHSPVKDKKVFKSNPIYALNYFAKDYVLAIEPTGFDGTYELTQYKFERVTYPGKLHTN